DSFSFAAFAGVGARERPRTSPNDANEFPGKATKADPTDRLSAQLRFLKGFELSIPLSRGDPRFGFPVGGESGKGRTPGSTPPSRGLHVTLNPLDFRLVPNYNGGRHGRACAVPRNSRTPPGRRGRYRADGR